jgi:hypothetical protein
MAQKKEIISKSTIKLEGKNTDIRALLDIDGFYQSIDSPSSFMMFFEDETFVTGGFIEKSTEKMRQKNFAQSVEIWREKGQERWGYYWGVYKIEKDTLIVHSFRKALSFNDNWSFDERRYEIIDRQTLKLIYMKSLLKSNEQYYRYESPYKVTERNIIDKFVHADSLPSSDCWLKEEKWIWRNESDWKEYMEKIKNKRRKKK